VSDRAAPPVTFVVRVSRDRGGRLRGIVERVKTGAKAPFTGADALAEVIDRMVRGADGAGEDRR